jgi:hypothetical protein
LSAALATPNEATSAANGGNSHLTMALRAQTDSHNQYYGTYPNEKKNKKLLCTYVIIMMYYISRAVRAQAKMRMPSKAGSTLGGSSLLSRSKSRSV